MSRRMQSGRLRQLVTWQINTSAPVDGSCGQDVQTPVTQRKLWAEVIPSGGSVAWNADQLKGLRVEKIRIREGPAISAGHLLLLNGRTLTVNLVEREDERDFWLMITAVEQAQGQTGGP